MKILVAYATQKGSTGEVAEFIGEKLREHDFDVTVARVETVTEVDSYHAFVLGTGIYKGMWLPELFNFTRDFQQHIGAKPVFGWVNCIRILEPNGYEYVMENYLPHDILKKLNVQDYKVFAGKLRLDEINMEDRWTLALHYDGRLVPNTLDADFRDWGAIRAWADQIAERLRALQGQL